MKEMEMQSYYLMKSFLEWGKFLELKGLLFQMRPGQGSLRHDGEIKAICYK
jgi:hypothetical protein